MSTYPAELYAAVHRGNPGDVDYYRRVCSGVDTALELGCGWGRIAHAVAADGVDVMGLELDPDLRAMAPAGPATILAGDMRDFSLETRFDRVLIPYNGLYYLLDPAELVACLRCARAHLAPGGLLVFDGYAADAFHATDPGTGPDEDELGHVSTAGVDGRRFHVYEQSLWEPDRQRITARYVHVPEDGGPSVEAFVRQRYLLSAEVAPLLAQAGLELITLQGGFDQSAFDPEDSEMLIAVACSSS
ncbi:MAG: class I SAM-dependent methyltransferase [Myxococcota bacterium]